MFEDKFVVAKLAEDSKDKILNKCVKIIAKGILDQLLNIWLPLPCPAFCHFSALYTIK
jgi:hypothetical protein